jgi:nitrate reductase gamma subunit
VSTARAIITGILVVLVAFVVLLVVPNQLLQLSGMDRSRRVMIATLEFFIALVALLWGLRRLQSRHVL